MGRSKRKVIRSGKSNRQHTQVKQQNGVHAEEKKKPDQQQRPGRSPWKAIVKEYEKVYSGCGISKWKPPRITFDHERLPHFPTLTTTSLEAWPSEDARKLPVNIDDDCLDAAASAGRCRIKRLLYGINKDNLGIELVDHIDQLLSDSTLSFLALAYRFQLRKRRKVQRESDRSPLERQKHLAHRFLSYCFSINEPNVLATWIGQLFSHQTFPELSSKYSTVADFVFVDRQIQLIWQTGHELGAAEMRVAAGRECSASFRARRLNIQQATTKARNSLNVTYVALTRQSEANETARNEKEVHPRLCRDIRRGSRIDGTDEGEEDEIMIQADGHEAMSPSTAELRYSSNPSPSPPDTLRDDVISSTRAMLNLSSRLLDQNSLSDDEYQVFSTWLSTVSTVTAALSYKAPKLTSRGRASRQASSTANH